MDIEKINNCVYCGKPIRDPFKKCYYCRGIEKEIEIILYKVYNDGYLPENIKYFRKDACMDIEDAKSEILSLLSQQKQEIVEIIERQETLNTNGEYPDDLISKKMSIKAIKETKLTVEQEEE